MLFFCRTLNNNNLTTLPRDLFGGMPRLRALRLSENPFSCDCHLSWLSRYLKGAPRLAPYTKCHSPSQLKGQNVADLHDQEFKCSGNAAQHCTTQYPHIIDEFLSWAGCLHSVVVDCGTCVRSLSSQNNRNSIRFIRHFDHIGRIPFNSILDSDCKKRKRNLWWNGMEQRPCVYSNRLS